MKDFDLAAAKRGATVCTRDGSPVRILAFDCRKRRKGNVACPIVAEVFFKDDWEFKDGNWAIADYDESGKFLGISTTSEHDLMMADEDNLEKLERGEYDRPDHIGDATGKAQKEAKKIELGELVKAIDRLNDTLIESKEILCKMQSVWEDINRKTEDKNYRPRYLGPCG